MSAMCLTGTSLCFYFIFSVVWGSSVFTRSMIRMPGQPSTSTAMRTYNTPVTTTSPYDDNRYEMIYPLMPQWQHNNDNQSRSLNGEKPITYPDNNNSKVEMNRDNTDSSLITSISANVEQNQTDSVMSHYKNNYEISDNHEEDKNTFQNNQNPPLNGLKPFEWTSDENTSSEIKDISDTHLGSLQSSLKIEKGFSDLSFWVVLQRFFNCGWSQEWLSCLRESFSTADNSFFVRDLLVPSTSSVESDEEDSEEYTENDDFQLDNTDQDEGRKKLSKKLQSLLPLLLMLKMTMIPALTVMALMTGKAFLVSLISLGVALFSAIFSPKGIVSASKRHEIASQSPTPPDQTASNYYYMM